jgi:hypothetical protein
MRRAVISILVAAVCLTSGCAYSVPGKAIAEGPVDTSPPFSVEQPAPTTSSRPSSASPSSKPASDASNVFCGLLSWKDLPYKTSNLADGPTQTGYDPDFDQSCKWQSKQNGLDVGVTLRFRDGKPITLQTTSGTFDVGGRTVTYFDRTNDKQVQPSCVLVLDYAGGGLGIVVIDGSDQFGPICDQGKHVAEVMLAREPK